MRREVEDGRVTALCTQTVKGAKLPGGSGNPKVGHTCALHGSPGVHPPSLLP